MLLIDKFEKNVREFTRSSTDQQLNSVFRGLAGALGDCLFATSIELERDYSTFRVRAGAETPTALVFSKILFIGTVGDDVDRSMRGGFDLVDVSSYAAFSQSSAEKDASESSLGVVGKPYKSNVCTLKEEAPWWQAVFPTHVKVRHILFYRRFDRQIVQDKNIQIVGVDPTGAEVILHSPQGGEENRTPLAEKLIASASALQNLSADLEGEARTKFVATSNALLDYVSSMMEASCQKSSEDFVCNEGEVERLTDSLLTEISIGLGAPRDFGASVEDGLDFQLENVAARHVRFRCYGALPRALRGVEIYGDDPDAPFLQLDKKKLKFTFKAPALSSPESYAIGLKTNIPSRRVDLGEVRAIKRMRIWNLDSMDAANTLFLEVAVRSDGKEPWKVIYDHGAHYRHASRALKLVDLLIGVNWTPHYSRLLGKMFTQYRQRPVMLPLARIVREHKTLRDAIFEGSNEVSRNTRFAAPLRLGKHGLGVPIAFRDTATVMGHLVEMRDRIRAMGYTPLFMYGTLLGAIREKDFIPHDDDVDLAIILEGVGVKDISAECDALIKQLNENGVKAKRAGANAPLIHCHRGPVTYDIFVFAQEGDKVFWQHKALETVAERADIFLPASELEFKGEIFDAPNNPEAVCEARYGADWRVPNAAFEW